MGMDSEPSLAPTGVHSMEKLHRHIPAKATSKEKPVVCCLPTHPPPNHPVLTSHTSVPCCSSLLPSIAAYFNCSREAFVEHQAAFSCQRKSSTGWIFHPACSFFPSQLELMPHWCAHTYMHTQACFKRTGCHTRLVDV